MASAPVDVWGVVFGYFYGTVSLTCALWLSVSSFVLGAWRCPGVLMYVEMVFYGVLIVIGLWFWWSLFITSSEDLARVMGDS